MQAVLIFRLHQLNVRPPPQLPQILESQTLAMKYIGLEVTPNMSAHNPLARTNYMVRPRCNTPLYLKETTATEKWHCTAACVGGAEGWSHGAAGRGSHRREMRLPAGPGSSVNRCVMTALGRLASFRVWLSSASSLLRKVLMRTKLAAAMASRASTIKSQIWKNTDVSITTVFR